LSSVIASNLLGRRCDGSRSGDEQTTCRAFPAKILGAETRRPAASGGVPTRCVSLRRTAQVVAVSGATVFDRLRMASAASKGRSRTPPGATMTAAQSKKRRTVGMAVKTTARVVPVSTTGDFL
jgi:hypothetical protein